MLKIKYREITRAHETPASPCMPPSKLPGSPNAQKNIINKYMIR